MTKSEENEPLYWKLHTPNILEEILKNPGTGILVRPLQLLANLLCQVGERAAQLDDPVLNDLMCKLTVYSIADPHSKDYNPERVAQIALAARVFSKEHAKPPKQFYQELLAKPWPETDETKKYE